MFPFQYRFSCWVSELYQDKISLKGRDLHPATLSDAYLIRTSICVSGLKIKSKLFIPHRVHTCYKFIVSHLRPIIREKVFVFFFIRWEMELFLSKRFLLIFDALPLYIIFHWNINAIFLAAFGKLRQMFKSKMKNNLKLSE